MYRGQGKKRERRGKRREELGKVEGREERKYCRRIYNRRPATGLANDIGRCLVLTPGGGAQAGVMWRASFGVIRAGPRRPALRALISFPFRMPFISPVRSHAILAVLGVLSRVRAEASSLSGRSFRVM